MAMVRLGRGYGRSPRGGRGLSPRLLIAGVILAVAVGGYFLRTSVNPITGRTERVALSVQDEVALGLQAAPEMAQMHGGLSSDAAAQALVDRVGGSLVSALRELFPGGENPYPFEFHVLADREVVNAFALPGGQVFITEALLGRLETEGQVAGVLAHEIGHVVERHGAERLAQQGLMQGVVGAVGVAAYDPDRPETAAAAALAQAIGTLVTLKYGRQDELESDEYGVRISAAAGYDPRAMIRVMEILRDASGERGGPPEFLSTHPDPGNRIERIQELVRLVYPNGVPTDLRE